MQWCLVAMLTMAAASAAEPLNEQGLAALSGVLVQLLTSGLRATVLKRLWPKWGWLARVIIVAVVAAAVAGASGWAIGLGGFALAVHVASAFFVALGWRQIVKRVMRELSGPPGLPLPDGGGVSRDPSIRTRPPGR